MKQKERSIELRLLLKEAKEAHNLEFIFKIIAELSCMDEEEMSKDDSSKYIIKDCDVFEEFPGCVVNKTYPLRLQIEGLYSMAGLEVKVKIASLEKQ